MLRALCTCARACACVLARLARVHVVCVCASGASDSRARSPRISHFLGREGPQEDCNGEGYPRLGGPSRARSKAQHAICCAHVHFWKHPAVFLKWTQGPKEEHQQHKGQLHVRGSPLLNPVDLTPLAPHPMPQHQNVSFARGHLPRKKPVLILQA